MITIFKTIKLSTTNVKSIKGGLNFYWEYFDGIKKKVDTIEKSINGMKKSVILK